MKHLLRFPILVLISFMLAAPTAWADGDGDDLDDIFSMSLDDLADIEVTLASISAAPIREQSAIVSVITSKEIRASGARDLMDVLMLVPGYHFGVDVEGATGIGIRGFWAYEGKSLITLDGIDIVEYLFGVVPLGEHIPADQIEQVEIIRGPGSAMYGGNAELSVINIVTKGAKLNGAYGNLTYGSEHSDSSGRIGGGIGKTIGDVHTYLQGSYSADYRSTGNYTDWNGTTANMTGDSDIVSMLITAGVDYKDFEFRFLYDKYEIEDIIEFGEIRPVYQNDFDSIGLSVKNTFNLSEDFSLTPKFTYNYQQPWDINVIGGVYEISTDRFTMNLTGVNKFGAVGPITSLDFLAGGEFYLERAKVHNSDAEPPSGYYYTDNEVDYKNYSAFAQVEADNPWVDVTLGGRYHHHSEVGGSFVPRAALTKSWTDVFHTKALFSQAFRTPQIEIIKYGPFDNGKPTIKSETTTSYEIEAGYRLSESLSVTLNAFWVEIEDILVYSSLNDNYTNFDEVTNYGFEAEARFANKRGNAAVGYSFYRNHHNDVPAFCTKGAIDTEGCGQKGGLMLGFPAHKLTFNGTYFLGDHWSFNVNTIFISKRISYTVYVDDFKTLNSLFLANLFLQYQQDDFSFGIGVRDVFDKRYDYVQPFYSGVKEHPGKGREFFAKATFEFNGFPFN